jgi:capsule polysaccharide modification protein KpsS
MTSLVGTTTNTAVKGYIPEDNSTPVDLQKFNSSFPPVSLILNEKEQNQGYTFVASGGTTYYVFVRQSSGEYNVYKTSDRIPAKYYHAGKGILIDSVEKEYYFYSADSFEYKDSTYRPQN